MARLGLVVDGLYDRRAISALVRKCRQGVTLEVRQCGGRNLSKAIRFLKELDRLGTIEYALWVTDSEGQPSQEVERLMKDTLKRAGSLSFEVTCIVAVRMLEAWLLADESARAGLGDTDRIFRNPERLPNPKRVLTRLLGRYTDRVAEIIADAADVDVIASRCPSFAKLREALRGD